MWLIRVLYVLFQQLFILPFFKPPLPDPPKRNFCPFGRIAVIGAGLTGISSAAHAISHGFDVVIFEKDDRVGGIWAHVNSTSALQLNSVLYRFHPAVVWKHGFPQKSEILGQIKKIWVEYRLEGRTRFNTPVDSVRRATDDDLARHGVERDESRSQWVINQGDDGIFDAIICAIGTCGDPSWIQLPGMPKRVIQERVHKQSEEQPEGEKSSEQEEKDVFQGPIIHSSELDSLESDMFKGKTLIVIGSGASGVEAVETALQKGAKKCIILARDDKWIIPRNTFIDTLIALQPFGRQMPLSFIWEWFIKFFHYRGLRDLAPAHTGLFESTPVVNNAFLSHVRKGRCIYVRGDTQRLTASGVEVTKRSRLSKPGDKGTKGILQGDIVVLATGYHRPELSFFPKDEYTRLFPSRYERPELYLQTFATGDWSVLLTNAAYVNAIGTVGHVHIGIYTRILLAFLLDPQARPDGEDMKLWVDAIRWIKKQFTTGKKVGLGFFTYMELTLWFLLFHIVRIERVKWMLFIMQGWGVYPS